MDERPDPGDLDRSRAAGHEADAWGPATDAFGGAEDHNLGDGATRDARQRATEAVGDGLGDALAPDEEGA